jgi:hypothetical protein
MVRPVEAATAPAIRYDTPFHWWGPGWEPPAPLGLADLLRNGTLDVATAAVLWSALGRRRSLVVIGGRSGIGKTTLLTALASLLPSDMRRLHLRGCYERFAFLHDSCTEPAETALLVNEISPHLPYYLWGPGVGELLAARRRGYTLLATAHGESLSEFVATLTGSPLRIPAAHIAGFDFVAVLSPSSETASGRRLSEIWSLQATPRGLAIDRVDPNAAGPLGVDQRSGWDLERRRELLAALREGASCGLPALSDVDLGPIAGPRGTELASDALIAP